MIIAAALLTLLALAPVGVIAGRWRHGHAVVYVGTAIASLVLLLGGLAQLGGNGTAQTTHIPMGLPWVGAHFRLDNLSGLFLVIINLSAVAASIFAVGYTQHLAMARRVTPFFPLFLFGMNTVLLADDGFVFLLAWEFMSLSSWMMVLSDHKQTESRRAALVYLTMAVFGTFCLLPAFGLMAGAEGSFTFETMRAAQLSPLAGALVVVLVLLGGGSKAGLVPLHVWLPLAHPAAPSHVSALMSGVMTKVALYGIIRILFDLHGEVGWQWGALMMMVGGVTAVVGVLYAVLQDDLKTLLAYSTVENVGVAVIGLGLALSFKDNGEPTLAALALVAGLYHMLNHSVFKSLLFLGTGAVMHATGERRISALGGLLKRMPATGALFLIGAAAISALPPLNGFVSEWLIFHTLFKGPALSHWAMKFGVPVVGAFLALAAALAAACFVRAFGIAFLGRPRSTAAAQAREVTFGMRAALAGLAFMCVVLGVIPVTVTDALSTVVQPLTGVEFAVSADLGWPWLSPVSSTRGSYSGTILVMAGLTLFGVTLWLVHHLGNRTMRSADAWDCGHPEDIPESQYTGHSFAQPMRRAFGATLFRARETVVMPEPGDLSPARHEVTTVDPIWTGIYARLLRIVEWASERVNHLQYLTVRGYLLMMFSTLVVWLLVVAVRQQL